MSTYLQLCQDVARESGTVADLDKPSTVTGQTGRLRRIVTYTAEAYRRIQIKRHDWRWLRKEFDGETLATVRRYKLNTALDRFRAWVFEDENGDNTFSCYLTADGQDTEYYLEFKHWDEFKRLFLYGSAADDTGPPAFITVDPANQLTLYPIPDDAYTLRGEYMRGPQVLSADGDIPEMPLEHHDAIKWQAIILLANLDEGFESIPMAQQFLADHMVALTNWQTPRIQMAEALA